jgi:hypothetical protein
VRLTAGGRALVVVAALLFAGALVAAMLLQLEAQRQASNRRSLIEQGVVTSGEVIRLWPRGDNRRRVRYRFAVDGVTYENQLNVSSERRRTLQLGSRIDVRFVPDDPRVNDLGGQPRGGLPAWFPPVLAVAIAGVGLLLLLVLNRQRRLLMTGRAAPAIVTAHKKFHTSHGGTHHSITFEFALLSGAARTGKASTSSRQPAIGSVICIVYDPDQPSRHGMYPFSLVKPTQ